ncbi:1,4-dihydroxy-2-naphthoate polyprenyltransferase [Actinomycetaceae bacterium MB13-C1-2]|nr:1,4-dihydroxy-2-naphthoate polyprenyltransferase [Actinomycetaceae bacterium MB13-C1-2]
MTTFKDWVEGARLRTLPAAIGPVILGAGAALHLESFSLPRTTLALVTALALQVGVNYSNDYSDGVRGSDADRVGPPRLTGGGLAKPSHVLFAALGCFALAGLSGLALIVVSHLWWLLLLGILAVLAAWFYTGGKKPYGYAGIGLSELLVFIFFGLFATVGTTYVQAYSAPWWLWVAASGIGLASVTLLMVNNVRDMEGDARVGKKTIAVRLGPRAARLSVPTMLGTSSILAGIATLGTGNGPLWSVGVFLVTGLCAATVAAPVMRGSTGGDLLPTLRNAGLYALAYGLVLGAVFAIGASGAL